MHLQRLLFRNVEHFQELFRRDLRLRVIRGRLVTEKRRNKLIDWRAEAPLALESLPAIKRNRAFGVIPSPARRADD
jgi:hypothetical protein